MQDCILDFEPLSIRQFLIDGEQSMHLAPRPETTRDMRSISHTIAWLDDAAPVEKGSIENPYKLFESCGARSLVDGDRDWCALTASATPSRSFS